MSRRRRQAAHADSRRGFWGRGGPARRKAKGRQGRRPSQRKDAHVTRELKLALIVGFALVLVVTVLISDHLSHARQTELAGNIPAEPIKAAEPPAIAMGNDSPPFNEPAPAPTPATVNTHTPNTPAPAV